MEFKPNRFYKLVKELDTIETPKTTNTNYYNTLRNHFYGSYGSYDIDSTFTTTAETTNYLYSCLQEELRRVSNVPNILKPHRFNLNNIYQSFNEHSLYDENFVARKLSEEEIACFEEVDVGLSPTNIKFLNKEWNKKRIITIFKFNTLEDFVYISMSICCLGQLANITHIEKIQDINEGVHNAYLRLKKEYSLMCKHIFFPFKLDDFLENYIFNHNLMVKSI
jgi:hypothetical protein